MRAMAWVMRDPRRWSRALRGSRIGRLAGVPGRDRLRWLPPPLSAWTASRDLPKPPPEPFRAWWARHQAEAAGTDAAGTDGGRDG
jgi:L-lactate dehydrogenase complex protein LldF